MPYSRRSPRSPRSRFTLGLLVLTAITILVVDLPGTGPLDPVRGALSSAFRPIQAAGNTVFEPIANGWKGAFGYRRVKDENDELRSKLEKAKGDKAELERLRAENAELKKVNGIETGDEPYKTVEVISGPITSFEQTIEIDAGSGSGIKRGMAVVTLGGVLGRIAEVHRSTSDVELLTDPSVSLGVRLKKGDLAVATGAGRGKPLRLEGVEDGTKVKVGDPVYTSGIDRSAFPKDLLVGRVSHVGKSSGGLPRIIEVRPAADLDSRYVRVIKKAPPS